MNDLLGIVTAKVNATSGRYSSGYNIEIDVRNPNPPVYSFKDHVLKPGKKWTNLYVLPGMKVLNSAVLELSSIPPVDFGRRLKYLIQYPHGCLEQKVSAAFPQLFLPVVMETDENMRKVIDRNIKEGIRNIQKFTRSDGGFSYWPDITESNGWATSYAGHFLIEAQKHGYVLPYNILQNWADYQ